MLTAIPSCGEDHGPTTLPPHRDEAPQHRPQADTGLLPGQASTDTATLWRIRAALAAARTGDIVADDSTVYTDLNTILDNGPALTAEERKVLRYRLSRDLRNLTDSSALTAGSLTLPTVYFARIALADADEAAQAQVPCSLGHLHRLAAAVSAVLDEIGTP